MKVKMVCLEDGTMSCGFRKMAAFAGRVCVDTGAYYVSTNHYRSLSRALLGRQGGEGILDRDCIDEIAQCLKDADLIGFSSMTGYSELTKQVIARIREITRRPFIIWGGIHPIIHPEDAIEADVDAICVGEGEFAFEEFFDNFQAGRDFTGVENFWFKQNREIKRNGFMPLMTPARMEELPFPQFGEREWIYKQGRGFVPLGIADYLQSHGLSYNTLWSIGCPFKCNYCGNTKFIANDANYRRIRHPSAKYMVEEIKSVRNTFPHLSTVVFHDDSFMAIPFRELEEFATLWREDVNIPFAVYGVIPNYVREDKMQLLTWAGMNRIRMGIQSGSQRILDFYKRPTPVERVESAVAVCASYSPQYNIPPAYDFIMDNPIETRQDVVDTLELAYRMARPYTLNLFSLKVIPNTDLEQTMKELDIDLETISSNYVTMPPVWANVMMYILAVWRPPRWLFDRWLAWVEASSTGQRRYPIYAFVSRALFLFKRGIEHLRYLDFSVLPGAAGYFLWRIGLISLWWRQFTPRPPRPSSSSAQLTQINPAPQKEGSAELPERSQ